MRWFRDHIRRGSWLALIALAINIGLSFGHFHAIGDFRNRLSLQITAIGSPSDGQTQGHHDSDQADLLCPICVAAGALGHVLTAAPPVLPSVIVQSSIDPMIETVLAVPQSPRAAFQSRAPPIS